MEFRRQVHVRMAQRLRGALFATTALTALALIAAPTTARAQSFQGLGFLPGGTESYAFAVSADGSVVVGQSNATNSLISDPFLWTQRGGMVDLGVLPGAGSLQRGGAFAVSADGSVVVGQSNSNSVPSGEAFRWTQRGGMIGLGTLGGTPNGGTSSTSNGVSTDGSVVVGQSTYSTPFAFEAFSWTQASGMIGLGFLPGGAQSSANAVSADGSTVVGFSEATGFTGGEAFRWTQSGGMVGLGFLPGGTQGFPPGGIFSRANAVSADGSVVVGRSTAPNIALGEAFRWTQSGGMVALGVLAVTTPGNLPGNTFSTANAVSADGSIVVGSSSSLSQPTGEAFRWSTTTGMQAIQGLLVASGVNMTGWTLASASGVSADGSVIVGNGQISSSQSEAWLARFSSEFGNGIITPGVAAQSFAGQAAVAQTGNAVIGGSLATMSEYATQAHNTQGTRTTPYSVFAYANYDSDPSASGTFGMTVNLPDAMVAGAAASANYINTNMVYDGSAKM